MTEAGNAGGKVLSKGRDGSNGVTVSFAEVYEASGQFEAIFKEGMGLVERTASYLDGAGRKEAKALSPQLSVSYATESMRLTTRLLELASWLLVRRGLKDGDITEAEARAKRQRMKLEGIGRPSHVRHFDELPEKLRDLITQSFSLQDRILKLDRAIANESSEAAMSPAAPALNPVAAQMARIQSAFGG